jgi:hypothetical protein
MEACSFDESNTFLGPPAGMTEDEVYSLSIWRGNDTQHRPTVISCWKLTKEELEEINRTGRVWLGVLGVTMPPVWLTTVKPFRNLTDT